MHSGANKGSSWLIKWLKVYKPYKTEEKIEGK